MKESRAWDEGQQHCNEELGFDNRWVRELTVVSYIVCSTKEGSSAML